ncbi:ATP-binding protein [Stigmatella sp. ncwal1]|uniref:histidine kinase n=1 Tax=Stigmatella ashevillensis TaxID=2995309 RepID=A0ABT5DLD1_9BACT|nr:PAS domain-containing sensor histidine kinase [Stigmatella ashevillena]MDC0714475.1 ATP-binding protein [Stigmatella ashevillena]
MTAEELFSGDGEMAARMRAKDWASTPLGPVDSWPSSLKTIVRILLHSRHPMFLWWGPQLIQFYNDAYVPSFGKGKHPAALGGTGRETWPEIWPIIGPQIDDVMRQGKASWNEDQLVPIFRNGRLEDVYWTYGYSPVFDESGKISGTLVVCTETTSRVQSEKALRQSEDHLRRVVEASGAGTWEVDVVSGQMQADARMTALFRLPEQSGFGFQRALGRVHPDDRERLSGALASALAGETQGRCLVELRLEGSPGADSRWVELRGQVSFDAAGKATRFIGTALDISERKRAEEQLAESERLRGRAERERAEVERLVLMGQMAAGVAHEVNNPLSFVKANLGFLARELDSEVPSLDRTELQSLLRETQQGVLRIQQIVTDLKAFSRAGNVGDEERGVLEEALREASRLVSLRLGAGCQVELELDPALPVVRLSQRHMVQVMVNLLLNAADAVEQAQPTRLPQISVRARRVEEGVHLLVEDNGPGIPPEVLPRLFQPFFTTKPPGKGTGLGLALCWQYIARAGGTLHAENRSEGGARFVLWLPLAGASGA